MIESGNIVKTARIGMQMSQSEFAAWLSSKVGKSYDIQNVSRWECGRASPRKAIRELCAPLAADYIAEEILKHEDVSKMEMTEMIMRVIV